MKNRAVNPVHDQDRTSLAYTGLWVPSVYAPLQGNGESYVSDMSDEVGRGALS